MPGLDGFETARRMKEIEGRGHVPIIFLTGVAERSEVARGYSAGAVDYLLKPYEPEILRSKVDVFVDLYRLRRQAEVLTHRALHDPLTGLPNRTLFLDRTQHALHLAGRNGLWPAVLYLDLDGFKPVNDSYGHQAGDHLLRVFAQRLNESVRAADTAARLGGDEFAVLLHGPIDREGAETVIARIQEQLTLPIDVGGGRTAYVGASIGGAFASRETDIEMLIRHADSAMYTAKRSGRGRFVFHDPATDPQPA